MITNTRNKAIGLLTIRILLGVIFFFQGFGKVFVWGTDQVYLNFFKDSFAEILPDWSVIATEYYTSYIELVCGFTLIIGFSRNLTYYLLASVLVLVSIGHGMIEPIWNLEHVMYRAILLLPLFFLPREWDLYAIDRLLDRKAQ